MTTLDHIHEAPDPSNVSMMPTALKYGLLGGLVAIIYSLTLHILGMGGSTGNQMVDSVIGLVLVAGTIYFALTKHKEEDLGGYLSYGRAIGLGTLTALVMGVLAAIFSYIYMGFIDPSAMDMVYEKAREAYEEQGMDEDQIEMAMGYVEKFSSPGMIAMWATIGYTIMGLIASLIIGAIVKKNPPEYA